MNTQHQIILYQPDDQSTAIDVRVEEETVWLNRHQIAKLFNRDIKTIGKHINNALKEELNDFPVIAKFATTASDGKTYQVEHFNLDMILSIGYRVKSKRGIQFRRWSNRILKDYLIRGYTLNRRVDKIERKPKVEAIIYTKTMTKALKTDLKKHNAQYPQIAIKTFQKSHDRFLIIDKQTIYHIGASLKDLGKKWFAFSRMNLDVADILQKLENKQ